MGSAIADRLAHMTHGWPVAPRVRVVGTPLSFIPHGKPDAILAELGLDAAGVAASVRSLVAADARHPEDAPV